MRKSIVTQYLDYCIICGKPRTDIHHLIGGTSGRRLSEEDDLVIPLCNDCHNMSNASIHHDKKMNVLGHIIGELAWERHYLAEIASKMDDYSHASADDVIEVARESFRKRYGKCYS